MTAAAERALDRKIHAARRLADAREAAIDRRFAAHAAAELAKLSPEQRAQIAAERDRRAAIAEQERLDSERAEERRKRDRYMTAGT